MVLKFRIISDENKEFAREVLISGEHTFLDFHHCIQEDLGYDAKQLASFFLTNASWEKQFQITLLDMMDEEGGNCTTMDQVTLASHFSKEGQRLIYVFDFFSERSFFMELTEILETKDPGNLPKVVFKHGDPPVQIDLGLDNLDLGDGGLDLSEDEFSSFGDADGLDSEFPDDLDIIDPDDYS